MAFLVKEFADFMAARGHVVDVLTGYPNWPIGKCLAGYDPSAFTTEKMGDLSVYRIPFYASPNGSFWQRVLDFKSFEVNVKRFGRRLPRPDLLYVSIPPNDDASASLWLAERFKTKYVLNVQDIHPDSAIELGYVKNPLIIALLRHQERKIYSRAAHVTVIGENFRRRILGKGIAQDKVTVVTNWIDTDAIRPMDRINNLRKEWGIHEDKFVVLYAGTFGRVHNTGTLIETAALLNKRSPDILFLLVGQGHDFEKNVELANRLGLDNVVLKEFVPRSRLCELQALSDVSVVTLRSGFGNTSVPSKVLGYMSAGRGVIGLVDNDCDTAELINSAQAGLVLSGGKAEDLAEKLIALVGDRSVSKRWGDNAREYVVANLDSRVVLSRAAEVMEAII